MVVLVPTVSGAFFLAARRRIDVCENTTRGMGAGTRCWWVPEGSSFMQSATKLHIFTH